MTLHEEQQSGLQNAADSYFIIRKLFPTYFTMACGIDIICALFLYFIVIKYCTLWKMFCKVNCKYDYLYIYYWWIIFVRTITTMITYSTYNANLCGRAGSVQCVWRGSQPWDHARYLPLRRVLPASDSTNKHDNTTSRITRSPLHKTYSHKRILVL